MTIPLSENIAILALDIFSELPSRCKPRTLPDGRKEWTPMSAIALSRSTEVCDIKIMSVATGTKSLPVSALAKCNGLILHDSHAEILALRGFNYWLLAEIRTLLNSPSYVSDWLEFAVFDYQESLHLCAARTPPFRLRKGVEISLFSTEAPCGDASMELLIAASKAAGQDITPWPTALSTAQANGTKKPPGRGGFSDLGALRRKPARADAEISMSKSCTDKLMLKQFTGLLSFPISTLVELTEEVFLKRMILYGDRWNVEGYKRAFTIQGRLANTLSGTESDVVDKVRFFDVETLPTNFKRFDFEKSAMNQDGQANRASNISALWIAGTGLQGFKGSTDVLEVLLNGVKQGFKQFDDRERKGSLVCRKNLLREACRLNAQLVGERALLASFPESTDSVSVRYSELKARSSRSRAAARKQEIIDRLGGWPKKAYEDDFVVQIPSLPIST